MAKHVQVITVFGSPDGTKAAYAGGGGGATFWSEPFDLYFADGSPLSLTCVESGGAAGATLDLFSYSTSDNQQAISPSTAQVLSLGFQNVVALTPTASGETAYFGAGALTTKRCGRWGRVRLVVPAGATMSVFAQAEFRIDR